MYQKGQGVRENHVQAVKWYRKGAEQGGADAQIGLGLMYYRGQGVPRDYVQAYKWAVLAVARSPAGDSRKVAAKYQDFIGTRMAPAQIAEAQRLADEWIDKHQ